LFIVDEFAETKRWATLPGLISGSLMDCMPKARAKIRPYHYLTVLGIVAATTVATLPLTDSAARAATPSCSAAQATAAADGTALTKLLDQLNAATATQTEDKAWAADLKTEIAQYQDLIDKFEALEKTAGIDGRTLEHTIEEIIPEVGKDARAKPFEVVADSVLEEIEVGFQGQLANIEQIVRLEGSAAFQNAYLLSEIDQAQLAEITSEMVSPVLDVIGVVLDIVLVYEAGVLLTEEGTLQGDLFQLDINDGPYFEAKHDIGGLRSDLAAAQEKLDADASAIAALDGREAAAKAAFVQATRAATAACQPTSTPTPTPTPTPTSQVIQLPATVYVSASRSDALTPGGIYLSITQLDEDASGQFTGVEDYDPAYPGGPFDATGSIDAAGNITFSYEIASNEDEYIYTGTAAEQAGGVITMSGTWCIQTLSPPTSCETEGNWVGSTSGYPPYPPN
jgi:hypothetical protein